MESLALAAALIVSVIFITSLLAFGFSLLKSRVGRILTIIFASIGFTTGIWIWVTLADGNGMFIGSIPVLISVFSVWNSFRRNKKKS